MATMQPVVTGQAPITLEFAVYYVEVTRLLLLLLYTGFFCFCLPLSFFFYVLFLQPYAKCVDLMYDSLRLSRSCLASFRGLAVSGCVCMCAPFFQRPLSSCAAPRVYRLLFAKAPQYYSCSVVPGRL